MQKNMVKTKQEQRIAFVTQVVDKKKKQNPLFEPFLYLTQIILFSLGLQAGDLSLREVIDNAYTLIGFTKAGKSTTTHILLDDSLVGRMHNGSLIIQPTTNKYAHIKIGNQMGQSQTQIPNMVRVQSKKKQNYYIADTPGYGDSKGVLKILSNGYYHYRLFSKVKNMKFILTFDINSLSNTGKDFINTIKQFTQFFKNYSQKKQQIWQSCCFLVTKVTDPTDVAQQNIIKRLQTMKLTNMIAQQQSQLKQFIKFIIKEKRIITIKLIKVDEKPQFKGTLDQIDKKITKWWSRKQKNGLVDLQPVAFQLGKRVQQEILKSKMSLIQYKQLIKYYDIIGKQFVSDTLIAEEAQDKKQKTGSIGQILQELVKDAMGNSQSHIFLDKMNKYVQDNYYLFDTTLSQVRQNYQKQLYEESDKKENKSLILNSNSSLKKENKKNFALKKFKSLQKIEQIKNNFSNIQLNQRSIEYINKGQSALIEIIKEFAKICYKKKNVTNIIYKYGYSLHRIIQQTKIFMLLIYMTADTKVKAGLIQQTNHKSFEITRQLKDFLAQAFNYTQQILKSPSSGNSAAVYQAGCRHDQITYKKLHQLYVRSYNINSLDSIVVNQPFVIFFTSIQISDYQIVKKQTKIVLQYAENVIKDIQNHLDVDLNEKKRLINRLIPSRINCQNLIHNCGQEQQQEKKVYIMMLINLTQALGKILSNINKFQYARQVYQNINDIDQIDQIYHKQIHLNPKDIGLRIQHSKFLLQHFRQEQSIRLLQKACQFVSTHDELHALKQQINSNKIKIDNRTITTQYQEFLFQKKDYYDFNEELQTKLRNQFKPK